MICGKPKRFSQSTVASVPIEQVNMAMDMWRADKRGYHNDVIDLEPLQARMLIIKLRDGSEETLKNFFKYFFLGFHFWKGAPGLPASFITHWDAWHWNTIPVYVSTSNLLRIADYYLREYLCIWG
jgi:hypothetical protein